MNNGNGSSVNNGDGMIANGDANEDGKDNGTLGDAGGTETTMREETESMDKETSASAAWWIALLAAVALIVLLCVLVPHRKRD